MGYMESSSNLQGSWNIALIYAYDGSQIDISYFNQMPLWNVGVEPMLSLAPYLAYPGDKSFTLLALGLQFYYILHMYLLIHQMPLWNVGLNPWPPALHWATLPNELHQSRQPNFLPSLLHHIYIYLLFHQMSLWNVGFEPMTTWSPLGTLVK